MHADLVTALDRELRCFVAGAGTRRALATTCHVGHLGGERSDLDGDETPSLRADLVERALDGLVTLDGASAWLTRGGLLATTDADLRWYAAAREGFGRHGLPLDTFVVMTRRSWTDVVSGERRTWRRVRVRPADRPDSDA